MLDILPCPQSEVKTCLPAEEQRTAFLAPLEDLLRSTTTAPRILVVAATAALKPVLVHAFEAHPLLVRWHPFQPTLREPLAPGLHIASIRDVQAAVRTAHPLSHDAFDAIIVCGTPPAPCHPMWRETLDHFVGVFRICISDSPDAELAALGESHLIVL